MKMSIKKAICAAAAALLMIVFSVAVTGCGEKEPEGPEYKPPKNCDVVLEAEGGWEETYKNFITLCDSYEEIQKALMDHGMGSWDNDTVKEYADKHEDKSYVACFYLRPDYNGPHRLSEVEVNGGKLIMYILYSRDLTAECVERSCLFIAGVDKSFVANVTECEYAFV